MRATIITIGGDQGAGKSTVAKKLVGITGYRRIYAGGILRAWCRDHAQNPHGLPFEDWYANLDPDKDDIDKMVDEELRKAAAHDDHLILEGRMAFYWPAPGKRKLTVYISVNPRIGAQRIFDQKKKDSEARSEEAEYKTIDEALRRIARRKEEEKKRYNTMYGIDISDKKIYDLVIDSSTLSADEITIRVLARAGLATP